MTAGLPFKVLLHLPPCPSTPLAPAVVQTIPSQVKIQQLKDAVAWLTAVPLPPLVKELVSGAENWDWGLCFNVANSLRFCDRVGEQRQHNARTHPHMHAYPATCPHTHLPCRFCPSLPFWTFRWALLWNGWARRSASCCPPSPPATGRCSWCSPASLSSPPPPRAQTATSQRWAGRVAVAWSEGSKERFNI